MVQGQRERDGGPVIFDRDVILQLLLLFDQSLLFRVGFGDGGAGYVGPEGYYALCIGGGNGAASVFLIRTGGQGPNL
jgi:hypothetical protein